MTKSVGLGFVVDVVGRFEDFLITLLATLPFLVRGPRLGGIVS